MRDNLICILRKNGYEATFDTVVKDGINKDCVILTRENSNTRPVVYLDGLYDMSDEELANYIINSIKDNYMENINTDIFSIWDDNTKAHLRPCLRAKTPVNIADNTVFCSFLDVEMYVRVLFNDGEYTASKDNQIVSCIVTYPMLNAWGIDMSELFAAARKNIKPTEKNVFGLNVLGVEDDRWGAVVLADTAFLQDKHDKYGDFYILPSSIHELLLVSADIGSVEDLKAMVRDVNNGQVAENERLSYNIYFYDGTKLTVK